MIQFKAFRQYSHVVSGLRFPNVPKNNFLLTYFSENSSFLEDYDKLNIKKIDAKIVVVPHTKIPRTRLTKDLMKAYKNYKLRSYPSTIKPSKSQNIIYDISQYLTTIDNMYKPVHYRQRLSIFIKNIISATFREYQNYQKVLIYSIDLTKPNLKVFSNRKFFPILQELREESFGFDHLILALITPLGVRYRLLVKNRKYILAKIINYLRLIKPLKNIEDEIEENEEELEQVSLKVFNQIEKNIKPDTKEQVKNAVKSYLSKDQDVKEKVKSSNLSNRNVSKIAIASILYKTSGNINQAKTITNAIPTNKSEKLLKSVDKKYSDQILLPKKPENTSTNVLVKSTILPGSNKFPSHLFEKRLVDFKINLNNDIYNAFKVLETKDLPFKIKTIRIEDEKDKKGEIEKSDLSVVKVSLQDQFGKTHNVQIKIPKIDPKSGTFRINGQKKCLINQIVLSPITFPKKYESRFESSYSVFRIRSKRTRKQESLEIFLGNTWLPLSVLLFYSFGFENTLKQYNIGYRISKEKPKKSDGFSCKINKEFYIYFENVNSQLQKELCKSFILLKPDTFKIDKEFGKKEYFDELIYQITGRRNSTYLISTNLENIVDPVAKQVLINQYLPTSLDHIMFYMASKVVIGFSQDRNDITNQRIRGSEVLVHFIQKQILSAHTDYKGKVLAGNKDVKFEIKPTETLSHFIRCEIVVNMEYANPLEEMAVMTRISPIGKDISGIPDKNAIQAEGRNVHETYYGNIDPLDTPEGEMIGISQQLAIGATITSARGMFAKKKMLDTEGSGLLSTSSCMIPFIENNDGARITMATQQARQMLPLKNPEPPCVLSGYEFLLTNVLSDSFIKRAPLDGKVIRIERDTIYILCKDKKIREVSLIPVHLKSGSGKNTLSIFKPIVQVNQIVRENQVIAEGSSVFNGTISMGKTLCTAYMPWKGFNFEDGIVINEKLINNNKLTSIHGIIEDVLIFEHDRVLEIVQIGSYVEKGKPLLRKTIGELEQILSFSEEDESEERIGQDLIKKSPGGVVVDIDVFCNIDESKFPLLKEYILRTRKKFNLSHDQKFTIKEKAIDGILIRFKIEQELKISMGDKLTNRYGGKGIICLVEKDEFMPKTPWGESVDIIINPIGIIGRSNIGQLFELYTGLISKDLGVRISTTKNRTEILNLLKIVYTILDGSKNRNFSANLIKNLSALSEKEFLKFVNQIQESGFCPIIIPPFQSPKQQQIREALTFLGHKSGYHLFLPEFRIKTHREVPVGYMYFAKLEHIASEKIYGRSGGPITKTLQPTGGKKREGGQRLGEADTYSLISYNCPILLSELMGAMSDDITSKNEIMAEIIHTGEATYREVKMSPARDLLNSYFVSLILENV